MKNAWKFLDSKIRAFSGIFQGFFRLKRAFSNPPFCAPTLCHPPISVTSHIHENIDQSSGEGPSQSPEFLGKAPSLWGWPWECARSKGGRKTVQTVKKTTVQGALKETNLRGQTEPERRSLTLQPLLFWEKSKAKPPKKEGFFSSRNL